MRIERKWPLEKPTEKGYLQQCKDASHVILCKERVTRNDLRLDPGCGDYHCGEYVYPTVTVAPQGGIIFKEAPETLKLRWTAHLPLDQTDRLLTATALRPRLAELRNNTGRFICPQLASGKDLAELRCFDPNYCDCVDFHGLQDVSAFGGGHTDPTKAMFLSDGLTQPELDTSTCKYRARSHGLWRYYPYSRYGLGNSNFVIDPCHGGGRCLVVHYFRTFDLGPKGEIDPHWYQALDPDSYGLEGDKDGLGVYWCRQQQCRNYYGRIPGFSRIIYSKEYSIRCPRLCE